MYKCDAEKFMCVKCDPPNTQGCNFEDPCKKTCGKFTPEDMIGTWRGFLVKNHAPANFDMGEYHFEFGTADLTVVQPDNTKIMYDVATT